MRAPITTITIYIYLFKKIKDSSIVKKRDSF